MFFDVENCVAFLESNFVASLECQVCPSRDEPLPVGVVRRKHYVARQSVQSQCRAFRKRRIVVREERVRVQRVKTVTSSGSVPWNPYRPSPSVEFGKREDIWVDKRGRLYGSPYKCFTIPFDKDIRVALAERMDQELFCWFMPQNRSFLLGSFVTLLGVLFYFGVKGTVTRVVKKKTVETVRECASEIGKQVFDTQNLKGGVQKIVKGIFDSLNLRTLVQAAVKVLALKASANSIASAQNYFDVFCSFVNVLVVVGLDQKIIDSFMGCAPATPVENRADDESFLTWFITAILTFVCSFLVSGRNKYVDGFLRIAPLTGFTDKLKKGASGFTEKICEYVTRFIVYIFGTKSDYVAKMAERLDERDARRKYLEAYPDWTIRALDVMTRISSAVEKLTNPALLKDCVSVLAEGEAIYAVVVKIPDFPIPARLNLLQTIKDLKDAYRRLVDLAGASSRCEPSTLYLVGPPNVGKSHAVKVMCGMLAHKMGKSSVFEQNKFYFARSPTSKHWDGYGGQTVVVYDDLFKNCNVAGAKDVDTSEWISIVSTMAFPAEQAAISDKGLFFTSEFIAATGNYMFPKTALNSEAVCRRMHTQVLMVWGSDNRDHRPDYSNVNFYINTDKIVTDLYNGVYHQPYDAKRDYPATELEFQRWAHKHHFQKITPNQIVDRWIAIRDEHAGSNDRVSDQINLFIQQPPIPPAPIPALAIQPLPAPNPQLIRQTIQARIQRAQNRADDQPSTSQQSDEDDDFEALYAELLNDDRVRSALESQPQVGEMFLDGDRIRPFTADDQKKMIGEVWSGLYKEDDEILRTDPNQLAAAGKKKLEKKQMEILIKRKAKSQERWKKFADVMVAAQKDVNLKIGDKKDVDKKDEDLYRNLVPLGQVVDIGGDETEVPLPRPNDLNIFIGADGTVVFGTHQARFENGVCHHNWRRPIVEQAISNLHTGLRHLLQSEPLFTEAGLHVTDRKLIIGSFFGGDGKYDASNNVGFSLGPIKVNLDHAVYFEMTKEQVHTLDFHCSHCHRLPFTEVVLARCVKCRYLAGFLKKYRSYIECLMSLYDSYLSYPVEEGALQSVVVNKRLLMQIAGYITSAVGFAVLLAAVRYSFSLFFSLFSKPVKNRVTWADQMEEEEPSEFYDANEWRRRNGGRRAHKTLTFMGEEYDLDEEEYDPNDFKNFQHKVRQQHQAKRARKTQHRNRAIYDTVENVSVEWDETQLFSTFDRIVPHTVKVRYVGGSACYGIQISASVVLVPAHIIPLKDRKNPDFAFDVITDRGDFSECVSSSCVRFAPSVDVPGFRQGRIDLMAVTFKRITACRKVVSAFAQSLDFSKVDGERPCVIVKPYVDPSDDDLVMNYVLVESVLEGHHKDILSTSRADLHKTDVYRVKDRILKAGDCGSLLFVLERGSLRIAGLYVSGSENTGYFQPITQDLISAYVSDNECKGFDEIPDVTDIRGDWKRRNGLTLNFGRHPESCPRVEFLPPTSVLPSSIQNENPTLFGHPCSTKPAKLTKEALKKALTKKFNSGGVYDPVHLERAGEMLNGLLASIVDLEPMNEVESICGNEDVRPLSMDSSPGFPWSLKRDPSDKTGGKRFLFDRVVTADGNPMYVMKEDLRAAVEKGWSNLKRGIANYAIFKASLKDERRDLERVLQGKTRLFTACPVDKVINDRRLFGNFYSQYKASRKNLMHAIGIAHSTPEWDELYRTHIAMPHSCALDYSNFDNSLPLPFTHTVYRAISMCYKPEWRSAVMASCVESTNHFYLVDGHVYQACQGNPSGHFLTTVLNSLTNTLLFFYSWSILCNKNFAYDLNSLAGFRKNVVLTTYGDDLIFSVSDDAVFFNGISFGESLAHLNVTATNADKSGELAKWTDQNQLTFLKRRFVLGTGEREKQYVGLLPKEIIEEIPMWRWEDSPEDSLICTVESALMEARLYGPEYFNQLWKSLCSLERKRNRDLIEKIDIFSVERRVAGGKESQKKLLFFNSTDPEHSWLSNFHPCQVESNGISFSSVEHAYVYHKLLFNVGAKAAEKVIGCTDAREAKRIGKCKTKSAWEAKRCFVMRDLLFSKFADPNLRNKLFGTSQYSLVEATPDTFWGAGAYTKDLIAARGRYTGLNQLGKILELVRAHLRTNAR